MIKVIKLANKGKQLKEKIIFKPTCKQKNTKDMQTQHKMRLQGRIWR